MSDDCDCESFLIYADAAGKKFCSGCGKIIPTEPPLPWLAINLERASLLAEAHDLAFYFAEGHRGDLKGQIATLTAQLAEANQKLRDIAMDALAADGQHHETLRQLAEARGLLERTQHSAAEAWGWLAVERMRITTAQSLLDRHIKFSNRLFQSSILHKDTVAFLSAPAPTPPDPRDNQIRLLKAAIRLTALRWVPGITHEQIDAQIEAILRGETAAMGDAP